ncbi:cytochrome-c peroxidase [Pedobacter sp.]
MKLRYIKYFLVIIVFAYACKKSEDIEEKVETFLGFQTPKNFPETAYNFANNPITKEGFELGRMLFYEPRLSRDNSITCGSCHIQASAFTQHGHDVSHGIEDRLGTRNSPPIMNLAWSKAFMWGGGIYDLDLFPISPITAHEEMDESLENVLNKLSAMDKYKSKFKAAFGTANITTANFLKALSQFMLMCVSSNAKYDKVMRKDDNVSFTAVELEGYELFKQKCASCHTEPLFTDNGFRNNGLAPSAINDLGLYTATLLNADKYKFKTPSLRNLKYTAPYMHDGRFLTLDAVFMHYTHVVQATENLDTLLNKNGAR